MNADELTVPAILKDVKTGENAFSYCNNMPIGNNDPSGKMVVAVVWGIAITAKDCAALIIAAALAIYSSSKTYRTAVNSSIMRFVNKIYDGTKALQTELTKIVKKARTKAKNSKIHKHHIVAKAANLAAPARNVLAKNQIGINSDYNLVPLSANFHQVLHTNNYYKLVNSLVLSANKRGTTANDRRNSVLGVLMTIRYVLLGADRLCK